jgi:tetratricopeptide (TPR) repeat protein
MVAWTRCSRFPAVVNEPAQNSTLLDSAQVHFARGETFSLLERWPEAIEAYEAAIAARPDYPEAWNRRGVALHEIGEVQEALASLEEALRLRPGFAEAHCNRSTCLRWLNRIDEALAAADASWACDSSDPRAFTARGHALRSVGRIEDALDNYSRALASFPSNGALRFNLAACLLVLGRFERGWREYEWRWQRPQVERRELIWQMPAWQGDEPITGRTILLHAEQGLGDTIQFCRYAPLVADLGARVVIGVPPVLRTLMATLKGVTGIVSRVDVMPQFDLQCPLLSLPLAFDTRVETIPSHVPYLAVPDAYRRKWRERLGPRRDFRLGLAWSGNPEHRNDHNRSMSLQAAMEMIPEGTSVYCLQRDLRARDVPDLAAFPAVRYFGQELADFADTAALIEGMDLVVSVDTSSLHLAGALGVPTWALLPFACDWRWLLDRADSPWYPTMRLFRQTTQGEWGPVVSSVRAELDHLAYSGDRCGGR